MGGFILILFPTVNQNLLLITEYQLFLFDDIQVLILNWKSNRATAMVFSYIEQWPFSYDFLETMEVHSSGYTEIGAAFFFFFRHSTFNSQWHLIGDIKMSIDRLFFFFSNLIWQEFPHPCFFFTALCCSLIWAYFKLLIKYVRYSLCNQELNHVRLTRSPSERILF